MYKIHRHIHTFKHILMYNKIKWNKNRFEFFVFSFSTKWTAWKVWRRHTYLMSCLNCLALSHWVINLMNSLGFDHILLTKNCVNMCRLLVQLRSIFVPTLDATIPVHKFWSKLLNYVNHYVHHAHTCVYVVIKYRTVDLSLLFDFFFCFTSC